MFIIDLRSDHDFPNSSAESSFDRVDDVPGCFRPAASSAVRCTCDLAVFVFIAFAVWIRRLQREKRFWSRSRRRTTGCKLPSGSLTAPSSANQGLSPFSQHNAAAVLKLAGRAGEPRGWHSRISYHQQPSYDVFRESVHAPLLDVVVLTVS